VNTEWEGVFSGLVGLWLALALLKFGNPVILDQQMEAPVGRDAVLLSPWPMSWGYLLCGLVFLVSLRFWRWRTSAPLTLIVLPLVWLGWQFLSAIQTVDASLTAASLKHFSACVMAFYVGLLAFSRVRRLRSFWIGLLGGFVVVLLVGWRQHFGGFEETRRFFYSLPDWQTFPPEFLKKVSSDRIYSTLFYPNALAGVIILLLPVVLVVLWQASASLAARFAGLAVITVLSVGCLFWSGSKAGWLIVLVQAVGALLFLPVARSIRALALVFLVSAGLAAFWLKNQVYFERGATSVSARIDYWKAGWVTLKSEPWLGSGPGTFMIRFKATKNPASEMTRLAHNDFLQQGSDSGWIGMLSYFGWFAGALVSLYRKSCSIRLDVQHFCIWLGVFGIAIQSFVEFGLYIPALAWPTFFFLGWLLGRSETPLLPEIKSTKERSSPSLPTHL